MDSKCHNQYQLKEASVVLTKLDDKIFSQDTLTVLSDNDANDSTKCENTSANQNIEENQTPLSDNVTQGSRKRRRKNEAPKRKIMRIDESYDVEDDIYRTYSEDRSSIDSDTDVDCCFTREKTPSHLYMTSGCGNNNANKGEQKDCIDSDKPKLYKTPIYIMKSKNTRSPDDSQSCLNSSIQTGITDPVTPHSHADSDECDFIDVTTITDSINIQSPVNSQDCQITSIDTREFTCHVSPHSPKESLRNHVNSEVQNEIINPVTSTTINSDTFPKSSTSENISNKHKVILEKETKLKKEKKVPNILSRAKRASKKPLKLKDTSSSLVEIRPKPHEHFKITTATRALLDETLNKHVVSPINRPVFNSTLPIILKDASDKAKSNTDKNPTPPNLSSAKSIDTSLTSQVKTPTNIPMTVNKFALSSTVSTAIKPTMSKPQYSSRLRSKSGTKYIVRKDSIISTNISDFLEPSFSSKLTKEFGSRLILKLPEKYLNETKFFKNFSPGIKSKQGTVSDSEVQGSSGLQISSVNVSPSVQINTAPKASPILKLTHSKEDYQYVDADERPIFLRSKGGLDDIMQELNMMNPELPKSPDVATKPEQTEADFQMIIPNKERKFSVKQITPTGLFLSNLKGRLMTHTKSSSKSTGSLSIQDITKPRIVQTFSMQQQVERNENDRRLREGTIFNDLHKTDDKRKKNFEKTSNFDNVQVKCKINKLQMRLNKPLSAEELKGRSENSSQRPHQSSNQQELNGNYFADDQSKPNSALPHSGFQQKNEHDNRRLSKMELASTTYQTNNEGLLSVTQIKQEPVDPMEESNMKPEGEKYGKIDDVKPNVLLNDSKPVFVSTNEIKSERLDSNEDLQNGNEKNKLHTYNEHEINQTDKKPIVEPNKEGSMKKTEIPDGRTISIERNYEYKFDDHAYTRLEREASKSKGIESEMYTKQNEENSQKIPLTVQEFETDIISETLLKAQNSITSPKPTSIPVYAVRCGERVVLFPASKAVTLGKPTKAEILPKLAPTPTKSQKQVSPSKNINKISMKKHQLERQKMNFVKKCALSCSQESNAKKLELDVNDLITRDFKHIIGKRPKNSMKHMCAVVVQITRSLDNKFTFSKDVLALSFTNGSNPTLVRWHTDGIHAALVTFNNKGKIQHLTVDRLLSGFYCLSLKNDPVIRKSRTFEGLLTSTLPNEDLLHSEKDFLAVGEIKSIMDPTLRKPDIKPSSGMTLTEALSDVLPKDLMQMYNPAVSDRSYIPKVHDKSWYSLEKFETFTRTYGRKRGYYTNGCRLPGEEVVN